MRTKIGLLLLIALSMSACSSAPRTKWTDPVGRLLIDPDSIDAKNYVRIQQALVESGKWFIVDRAAAFRAILTEQERLHRGQSDRFDNKEKYAIWGRLFGAGGIVVASSQCAHKPSFIGKAGYMHCRQFLSIVDANTGEVVTAVEGEADDAEHYHGVVNMAASWEKTVDRLNDSFPKNFQFSKYDERMMAFRAEAAEEAVRQQEGQPPKAPELKKEPSDNDLITVPDLTIPGATRTMTRKQKRKEEQDFADAMAGTKVIRVERKKVESW